jgi:hypothetical protein
MYASEEYAVPGMLQSPDLSTVVLNNYPHKSADGNLAGMMARVSERNLEPASAGVSQ